MHLLINSRYLGTFFEKGSNGVDSVYDERSDLLLCDSAGYLDKQAISKMQFEILH